MVIPLLGIIYEFLSKDYNYIAKKKMNRNRTSSHSTFFSGIKRIASDIMKFFANPRRLTKSPLEIRENSNLHD